MQTENQDNESKDRRKYTRLSVFSFMHAIATLSNSVSSEQKSRGGYGQYWTGLLEDISYDGAQVILPNDCRTHLKEHQDVAIDIRTTFVEDMRISVTAQVKYIVPAETHNGTRVGVQFTKLDINPQAQDAILRICEYGRKLKAVGTRQAEQVASAED
jgi:c-di-GMP-binding flagellar brake protein YcgR